jgi:predicted O-linked N-acetylglucosamine transferase (SPINDLY family)
MSAFRSQKSRRKGLIRDKEKLIAELTDTVDKQPNIPELYWFLGLAYLLNHQEEEAQLTWSAGIMLCFSEFDLGTKDLCDFLKVEAVELTKVSCFSEALPLWQQILDLDDSNLEAHLIWIDTAAKVDQLSIEKIAELGTIELLSVGQDKINLDLLLNATLKILEYPTVLSLDFLQASIPYFQEIDWLNPIMNLANHMAYDCKLFSYAVDIAKIVLEFEQHNFYVFNDLLKFYGLKKDQAGTLITAKQMRDLVDLESCESEFATYIFSKLLSACMATNDWEEVESLARQLENSLNELLQKKHVTLNQFLSGRFWSLAFPLLYLVDNPPVIRNYLNRVADIFQEDLIKKTEIQQLKILPKNTQYKTVLKRIGYIAHTLRKHSVGWLSRWLFKYHDRQKYKIYVYLI